MNDRQKTTSDAKAAEQDALTGTLLGKCKIERPLGEGGMGRVYLARHMTLDIEVAVKVLPPELARKDRKFVERFLREARAAARIHHPGIVQVLDVDFDKGFHYIVMEYVAGETASDRLQRNGRLNEAEVVLIGLAVADALAYTARKQIIHRDIKPENILISAEGEVKLADLGLAKSVGKEGSALTLADHALGTPFYIAPEQAKDARAAEHRSDLYALGATLFHLAAGRPPFKGSSAFDTMTKHLNEKPPLLRALRAEISVALEAMVDKLLAKNPDDRYPHAQDLAVELCKLYQTLAPDGIVAGATTQLRKLKKASWSLAANNSSLKGDRASADELPVARLVPPIHLSLLTQAARLEGSPQSSGGLTAVKTPTPAHSGNRPALSAQPSSPTPRGATSIYQSSSHRGWLLILFVPLLNALGFVWIGSATRYWNWLYGGLVLFLLQGLFLPFYEQLPAQIGLVLLYFGALAYGFSIRRDAAFRLLEQQSGQHAAPVADESGGDAGGPSTSG